MALVDLSRRAFLSGLGLAAGGLVLGVRPALASPPPSAWPAVPSDGLRPNAFVHLALDGTVTIVCARSEMGQGVRSSLPALIADELGAELSRVKIVQGDGDAAYGGQNTDGSSSVRGVYDELRHIGAGARTMLVAAAAEAWKVPPASCSSHDHAVHHAASMRSFQFEELVALAAKRPLPRAREIKLRPTSELRYAGKSLPLADGPDLVTGRAKFAADVSLPGMLTAIVVRPPVVGGKVKRYDAARTLLVPGVKRVVELPAAKRPFAFQPLGGIAILAEHTWAALRGAHLLDVSWDDGDNAAYDTTRYRAELARAIGKRGKVMRSKGDVDTALAAATRRVEAVYYTPHLAHAPMEPPSALARFVGDHCEVWACTQDPQSAREAVAGALGVAESKVTVHVTFLGGGFGRKAKPDFVVEAALLARAAGVPVRVQWTREDDLRHDYYHTTAMQKLTAGLDAQGAVSAWNHRIAFPPIGSTFNDGTMPSVGELEQGVLDLPLAIPNVRAEACPMKAMTRIGWLRSVANIYHAFAVQSFIDELAHARSEDPRTLRLALLGPSRHVTNQELGVKEAGNYGATLAEHPIDTGRLRGVIERVTELARWSDRKKDGRALGLAAHRSFLTYVAVVASAVRDARGRVRIDEAWIVADAGILVNEDRVRAQLEGSVIFGMSAALYGAITMKDGATVEDNLRAYRLTRIAEAPRRIHTELVRSEHASGGVGEPGVPPVAPAIANAIFALTGTRVRELPIGKTMLV